MNYNYLAPLTSRPGDFSTENTIDSHSVSMLDNAYKAVDSTPHGWEVLARADVPGTRACLHCGTEVSRRPTCRICNGVGTVESSFMFDTHPDPVVASTIEAINKKLDSGHSGSSYGWTMRNMESIAKKGWEVFMLKWRLSNLKDAITNPVFSANERQTLSATKTKLERMILDAETRHKNRDTQVLIPVATVLQQARTVDAFFSTDAAKNAAGDPLAFANAMRNDAGMRAMIPDIDQQADAMTRFAQGKMSYAEMRSLCG